jgi:hypothetical protein
MTPDERREACRRGGLTRARQFTSESQKAARAKVSSESCVRNGAKGARATISKYGYAHFYRLARAWRLEHPSSHEQQVMAILADLGYAEDQDYEREYEPFGPDCYVCVDIAFIDRKLAIEVNGKVHHDPLFENPNAPNTRAANEARRLAHLGKAGWRVLVIDYRERDDLDHVRRMIAAFLEVCDGCEHDRTASLDL